MDGFDSTTPALKARRLRRVTLVRGRHTWVFVCAPGEEAQLLRDAGEMLGAARVARRGMHLQVLARQLGVTAPALNPGVRKAD